MKADLVGVILFSLIITHTCYGQEGIGFSSQVINNKFTAVNNWSPATSINRQETFEGTALGFGLDLNYSVRPAFLAKGKNVIVNVGVGYFKQTFQVERPFDYISPLEPVFYTDSYSYHCVKGLLGVGYAYKLTSNLSLTGNLTYSWLHSFRQDYTPTTNAGYGHLTQVNRHKFDFGNMFILGVGFNRRLGDSFSISLNALLPLYTRWRNDEIFKDDPATFSHPKIGAGTSVDLFYVLKRK